MSERARVGAPLGAREMQVLKLMSEGKQVKHICRELSLSPRTINVYRERIGHKSGCKTSLQIGVWAAKQGLV